jgi:hypothetical protein
MGAPISRGVSRAHSQIRPLRWGALRSLPEAGLTKPAERSDLPTEIGRRTTDSHPSAIRRFARQPAIAKLPSERGGRSLKPCCFEQIPIATERKVQEGARGRRALWSKRAPKIEAAECRERAKDCADLAAAVGSQKLKSVYSSMARSWLTFANQIERSIEAEADRERKVA